MIFWLNIATIIFSLIACGFSAASIIQMRRTARKVTALQRD